MDKLFQIYMYIQARSVDTQKKAFIKKKKNTTRSKISKISFINRNNFIITNLNRHPKSSKDYKAVLTHFIDTSINNQNLHR